MTADLRNMIPTWVDGTLTPVEKLQAHRDGLAHMAVSVFVLCGSDLLIQRRAAGKYHTPLLWANTCCTHPHWGEDPARCAQRRLHEELGLIGLHLTHRGQVTYRADVGGGLIEHEIVDVYVARVAARVTPLPNPEEVADTAWLSLGDLRRRMAAQPEAFTPWLHIYLADHADQILGG